MFIKLFLFFQDAVQDLKTIFTDTSKWKWLTLLFALTTFVFLVLTITLWATREPMPQYQYVPNCASRSASQFQKKANSNQDKSALKQLTEEELLLVLRYLHNQSELNLQYPDTAAIDKSFVHTIELQTPPKKDVLNYYADQGPRPIRQAKVFIFRGDASPPFIGEYIVGPLPNITYAKLANVTARVTKIPYIYRPFSSYEFMAIYRHVIAAIAKEARHVLLESYNATPPPGCGNRCLRFSMTPVSSAYLEAGQRKAWFWFTYDVEFFTLHPVDFQFLVDMTDADPRKWLIQDVWYANQIFGSLSEFLSNYTCAPINKTRISFPSEDQGFKTSLQFRENNSISQMQKHPPLQYEPEGPRYTVYDNEIMYMAWSIEFKVSPTRGLELFNVKFDDERIIYEMSLQEVAVLYSGYSPTAKLFNYADSAGLFGTRSRGLMPSVDCPEHAEFVNIKSYSANENGLRTYENALCVFEHSDNSPLRRHRAYGRSGAFYGGIVTTYLVVRTIISVINYDYIIDYMFYQNGVVETRVSLTGYLGTSFYYPPEQRYGAHLDDNLNAGMHIHLFNFKIDLDIKGTENRFESLDIEMVNETDPWFGHYHIQNHYKRNVRKTESDAVYKFDFSSPKYLLVSNYNHTTDENIPRSYRIKVSGISKLLLPDDYGFSRSISWAKYQSVVTKRKDDEESSSSIFTMWDAKEPVVHFANYVKDNEDIVDKVN